MPSVNSVTLKEIDMKLLIWSKIEFKVYSRNKERIHVDGWDCIIVFL